MKYFSVSRKYRVKIRKCKCKRGKNNLTIQNLKKIRSRGGFVLSCLFTLPAPKNTKNWDLKVADLYKKGWARFHVHPWNGDWKISSNQILNYYIYYIMYIYMFIVKKEWLACFINSWKSCEQMMLHHHRKTDDVVSSWIKA